MSFGQQTPPVLIPLLPLTVRVLEAVGCVCVAEVGYVFTVLFILNAVFIVIKEALPRISATSPERGCFAYGMTQRCFLFFRFEADDLMASLGRWARER